jgi:hypothetical protein
MPSLLPSSHWPVEPRHCRKSNTPADHDPYQLGGSPTSRSGWTQIHRRERRTAIEDEAREWRQGWVSDRIWVQEWTLNARLELGTGMDDRFSARPGFERAGSLDRFGFPVGPTKPMSVCVGFRLDLWPETHAHQRWFVGSQIRPMCQTPTTGLPTRRPLPGSLPLLPAVHLSQAHRLLSMEASTWI